MTTRTATCGLALLTGLALLAAPGSPAVAGGVRAQDAAGDTEVAVFLAGSAQTGYGVYRRATAGGPVTRIAAPDPRVERTALSVSRDGSRVAYVEAVYSTRGVPIRENVVLRDVAGPFARYAFTHPIDLSAEETATDVALSPDGRTAVFSYARIGADDGPRFTLYRVDVLSGAPVRIPGGAGLVEPDFADAGSLIARTEDGQRSQLRWLSLSGGTQRAVRGAVPDDTDVTVSPAGDRVVLERPNPRIGTITTLTAPFTFAGGTWVVGDATPIASGALDASPSWRRDSSGVLLVRGRVVGEDVTGDLWRASASGTPAASRFLTTATDEIAVAVGNKDAVAPGAPTSTSAPVVSRTSVRVPVDRFPSDTDLSVLVVERTSTGTATTVRRAPLGGSVTDTGLTAGRTYGYRFALEDSSGNRSAWSATRTVTLPD